MKVTKANASKAGARLLEISAAKKQLNLEEAELKQRIGAFYQETGEKYIGKNSEIEIVVRSGSPLLKAASDKIEAKGAITKLIQNLGDEYIQVRPDVCKLEKDSGNLGIKNLLAQVGLIIERTTGYSVKSA